MRIFKRWAIIFSGVIVFLFGLIISPLPGPAGTPVMLAGLAILSAELPFAKKLREWFLAFNAKAFGRIHPQKRKAVVGGIIALYVGLSAAFYGFILFDKP